MVTVRTYWNSAEAALAKTLLDDHKIFCVIGDESANLYGGAPFAMPIRLLVDEDQAHQAMRILNGDTAEAIESETRPTPATLPPRQLDGTNPWELLALALYFLLPGICVLQTKYPAAIAGSTVTDLGIAVVAVFHLIGWVAVGFSLFLVALYFYVTRFPEAAAGGEDEEP